MHETFTAVVSIAVAAVSAFVASLGAWAVYQRMGLSGVQREVRSERGALIATLKNRVEHLEEENQRLTKENELLRHDVASLREQVRQLQADLIGITVHKRRSKDEEA